MENLLDRPQAFRFTYQLVSASPERILFALPRARLLIVALLGLLLGSLLLLHTEWFRDQPAWMVQVAGWGGVVAFVCLSGFVWTHRGRLIVDAATRQVRLEFRSLSDDTRWNRPFDAFRAVHTRPVKDKNGLHNHYEIELITDDETRLRVGYGLLGAVRRRSRDELSGLLAEMLAIPIEHAAS
jgi:hypothetical protein